MIREEGIMAHIPHPSVVITVPPAHDPVAGWMLLAVLAAFLVIPFAAGVLISALSHGWAGGTPGRNDPQSGTSDHDWVTDTLFAIPCDYCRAGAGRKCEWVYEPGEKTVVLARDVICHMPRIEHGAQHNLRLYLKLLAQWQGPLPPELELRGTQQVGQGLHGDGL